MQRRAAAGADRGAGRRGDRGGGQPDRGRLVLLRHGQPPDRRDQVRRDLRRVPDLQERAARLLRAIRRLLRRLLTRCAAPSWVTRSATRCRRSLHRAAYAAVGPRLDLRRRTGCRAGGLAGVRRRARRRLARAVGDDAAEAGGAGAGATPVTDRARLAGAANTLVLDGGRLARRQHRPPGRGGRAARARGTAAVVGRDDPGRRRDRGVGRAGALRPRGARRSRLLVRSPERARRDRWPLIAAHPASPAVTVGALGADQVVGDVVVSTIPVDGADRRSWSRGAPASRSSSRCVYDPWPTPLAAAAARPGRWSAGSTCWSTRPRSSSRCSPGCAAPLDGDAGRRRGRAGRAGGTSGMTPRRVRRCVLRRRLAGARWRLARCPRADPGGCPSRTASEAAPRRRTPKPLVRRRRRRARPGLARGARLGRVVGGPGRRAPSGRTGGWSCWCRSSRSCVALAVIDWHTRLLPDAARAAGDGVRRWWSRWSAGRSRGDPDDLVRAADRARGRAQSVFWLLWFIHSAGMGFGDVRLAALLGFALGHLGWGELLVGDLRRVPGLRAARAAARRCVQLGPQPAARGLPLRPVHAGRRAGRASLAGPWVAGYLGCG